MKRIIFLVAVVFSTLVLKAQNSLVDVNSINATTPSFFLDYLRDNKSADLFNADLYAGVEGSPFLSKEWAYARIRLSDNRRFDSVRIKVNLYENKVHFQDENGRERMIGADVREIEIRDAFSKLNGNTYLSGFGEDKNEFYQVVTDGKKIGLLKKMDVIIKETKVFNAPNKKSFELQDALYIYASGTLYEGNKNCSSISLAFNNDSKIVKYISENGLKCNKEKDLKAMVDFYNSY